MVSRHKIQDKGLGTELVVGSQKVYFYGQETFTLQEYVQADIFKKQTNSVV
jgi:hypothetical protein